MIRCQADFEAVVDCHSPLRALCEISYTCGSRGRPVLCECVEMFNYPKPTAVGDSGIEFEDACEQARADRAAAAAGGEL